MATCFKAEASALRAAGLATASQHGAEGCRFRASNGLTVAVLGAGKIGSIIAMRLAECGHRVIATARSGERIERLRLMGLQATRDNRRALLESQVAFIAVKPYQYPTLIREIEGATQGKVIVSVMAGIPLKLLTSTLPGAEVYRAMPNLNALIRRSSTALASPPRPQRRELVVQLLNCLGSVYEIPEELMDAWTATIGSGPAIIAEIVDSLILGALAVGIPRNLAYNAILDMLVGTAEYLRAKPEHPAQLRDEVTTPGGTTIRALKVIEGKGVKSAIIDAIEKATARARELAREIEKSITTNMDSTGSKEAPGGS
ncbi:MAG: pyrroline-5-carboxylate reductase [Crenarchaeota archaeon]|nr:pyrroline-5-carboxylate reductase [Thermoproteota archaeon]